MCNARDSVAADARLEQARRKAEIMAALEQHPFRPPWWLRGGHAQTIWSPLFRRGRAVAWRREAWTTPDDDWLFVHVLNGHPDKPSVLVLHGLEGSARSNYVGGLFRAFAPLGWTMYAMEYRGCSGEANRARRLYHNGETRDLAFVVRSITDRAPGRRLYIAGFSLGGNITGLWLGRQAGDVGPQVGGAAVVSAPYEPLVAGPHIDRVLRGAYARHFLKGLIPKAVAKERQFPGCMDIARVCQSRSLREFDEHATAVLHGFSGAEDYWGKTGCGQYLDRIRVPTLLLSAADDPFNPASTLPRGHAASSPYLHGVFAARGGHVGFVSGLPWRTRHWAEEQILRFFVAYEAFWTGDGASTGRASQCRGGGVGN
jgi:uncharacterized protein